MIKSMGGSMSGSYRDLAALASGNYDGSGGIDLAGGGPLSFSAPRARGSRNSIDSGDAKPRKRFSSWCLAFFCPPASWHAPACADKANLMCRLYRIILVANHLPIKATRSKDDRSWDFEWDDDALIAQAHVCTYCSCLPCICSGTLWPGALYRH